MEDAGNKQSGKRTLPSEPYRGIKPFRYADREIFAAREWEKEQLLHLVSLYRGSLVFGQSGIGKSSLINAGLIPVLEEYNFHAEIIRVSPSRKGTFIIYKIIQSDEDKTYFPSLFDAWDAGKDQITVSFEDFKEKILAQKYDTSGTHADEHPVPVLIFDQFEELITLFEEASKKPAAESELSFEDKKQLQAELIEFFRVCYYNPDLRVKFLFIFREDYLAKFSRLIRAIPELISHTLRIKAISKEDIHDIIKSPFATEDGKRSYPKILTEAELSFLAEKLKQYFDEDDAILTEIQIACQCVYELPEQERQILFSNKAQEAHNPIEHLIKSFYEKLLGTFPPEEKLLAIDILSLLVLNERTRNIFSGEAIVEELKGTYNITAIHSVLAKLDSETKLVKSEMRSGTLYYEINSESLIPYINDLKKERERGIKEREYQEQENKKARQKRNRILVSAGILLLIIASIIAGFQYRNSKRNEADLYLMAANRADNPSLKYMIARDVYFENKHSKRLNGYIETIEKKKNEFYISRSLYFPANILSVFFKGDTPVVASQEGLNYLDKAGLVARHQPIHDIIYCDAGTGCLMNRKAGNEARFVDTNELRTLNGRKISTFVSNQFPRIFATAPNGQSFLVDEFIYAPGQLRPLAQIIMPTVARDLMAAAYTKNGQYIIAGFWSGHVIVYNLKGKMIKAFQNDLADPAITSLAVTSDSKYVIVGSKSNAICFFELDELNMPAKDVIEGNEIIKNSVKMSFEDEKRGGQVSAILALPDNETFISVGENKLARVWNLKTKKIITLRGHKEGIKSAACSRDGKKIMTCSSADRIYIWQNAPAGDLYKNKELALLSPFDYRSVGLDVYSSRTVYKHLEITDSLFGAVLNYCASLPSYNKNPDDEDFTKVLDTSVKEISVMLGALRKKEHQAHLSPANKRLLYNLYARFMADSANLLPGASNDHSSKLRLLANQVVSQAILLEIDTADVGQAILLAQSYDDIAQQFADSAHKYQYTSSREYLERGIELMRVFEVKYKDNPELKEQLATLYGNLAWFNLFLNNYKSSINAARHGLTYGKKYDWINTNLALGYLLSGNFIEARKIYKEFKGKNYTNGLRSFNGSFLADFDDLERQGIISHKKAAVYREVQDIRKLLAAP
jgi:WD40 repeat protein